MRVGTKSILFGVHQFLIHPYFVVKAWRIIYHRGPSLNEFRAIVTHDLGYWGSPNMDGEEGEKHPQIAANWWLKKGTYIGDFVAKEILGHSRFYAAHEGIGLSNLFRADKLSYALYPRWLYLLLGNLSGEIHEYMRQARNGKYRKHSRNGTSQVSWLVEMQAHIALMGLYGGDYKVVKDQMEGK